MIHRVNNIYYLAIYRKSLPAPASIHYGLKLFFQKCADSIFLKENWKERILKENLIFKNFILISHFVVVQSLSRVRLFTTPWIAAPPGLLSLTISWSLFTHYLLISQIYFYLLIIYLLNKQLKDSKIKSTILNLIVQLDIFINCKGPLKLIILDLEVE